MVGAIVALHIRFEEVNHRGMPSHLRGVLPCATGFVPEATSATRPPIARCDLAAPSICPRVILASCLRVEVVFIFMLAVDAHRH